MHENHASIVALHRLKTFFKKSADTFASTQYISLIRTFRLAFYSFHIIFLIDSSNNSILRLDDIHSNSLSMIIDTSYENVEHHTKYVCLEDLTHQILDNRDSTIGSNQESLEKIGRWGNNTLSMLI